MNKNVIRAGKALVATKAKSSEVRKLFCLARGDTFKFIPVLPTSYLYVPELSDKSYFLTEVIRF